MNRFVFKMGGKFLAISESHYYKGFPKSERMIEDYYDKWDWDIKQGYQGLG